MQLLGRVGCASENEALAQLVIVQEGLVGVIHGSSLHNSSARAAGRVTFEKQLKKTHPPLAGGLAIWASNQWILVKNPKNGHFLSPPPPQPGWSGAKKKKRRQRSQSLQNWSTT